MMKHSPTPPSPADGEVEAPRGMLCDGGQDRILAVVMDTPPPRMPRSLLLCSGSPQSHSALHLGQDRGKAPGLGGLSSLYWD